MANRASLLLSGGTEEERRAWALEAARHFAHEGPLVEVRQPAQVGEALRQPRGVVFIPDVLRLEDAAQYLLLKCLCTQEERPKLVLGVSGPVEQARGRGALREDLHYRLHQAQVDLNAPGLRELLAQRRARSEAAREAAEEKRAAHPPAPARTPASARSPATVRGKVLRSAASARKVTRG